MELWGLRSVNLEKARRHRLRTVSTTFLAALPYQIPAPIPIPLQIDCCLYK